MQALMGTVTAVILAAFVAYAGAWYTGAVEGNFAVLLMLATAVTGVYWVVEKLVFLPRRRRAAEQLLVEHNTRKEALLKQGFSQIEGDVESARQKLLIREPGPIVRCKEHPQVRARRRHRVIHGADGGENSAPLSRPRLLNSAMPSPYMRWRMPPT